MRSARAVALLVLLPALSRAGEKPAPRYRLVTVARGLQRPVGLEAAPGDRERHYVLEQKGLVRVVRRGKLQDEPFLDLTAKTRIRGEEQGLLGLAFHPGFKKNRRFYLDYTDRRGDTVVSGWTAASPDKADPGSERVVLTQKQPYANHNGGQIAFGPDGTLFVALGDGGSAGDPHGNAQNLDAWLGKILRIDVDPPKNAGPAGQARPYRVPRGNPFADKPGAKPEIWAWGLRNPWRFSFDRNRLYIADVGQEHWEEIDAEDLREGGGKNYGWNYFEGHAPYKPPRIKVEGLVPPVAAYDHSTGACSVTGGFVYRGRAIPELAGSYLYGDYCTGQIWALRYDPPGPASVRELTREIAMPEEIVMISSFGRDLAGEIYVVNREAGAVYRLEPAR